MAFTAWPFDIEADGSTPQEVTEEQFRHSLAAMSQEGVLPNSGVGGTAALQVDALADSSGVSITSGYCQVGGYTGHNDTSEDVLVPANEASQPRLYWVVMRLDRTARTITPAVIEGAAAADPQLPALTRTDTVRDLPLAQLRRAGSGGGITNLIDRRVFINPDGSLNTRSDARPVDPYNGTRIFESDTNREMVWAGGQWRAVFDPAYPTAWQAVELRAGYVRHSSGFSPSWRWVRPGRVELRGTLARSNGGVLPDGDYYARVPTEARPNGFVRHVAPAHARAGGESIRLEVRSTNVSDQGRIVGWHSYDPTWVALDGWEYDIS